MRLKLVSLAILLVCASSLADNAAHAETQLSQEFETPHFVVRYDPSDPYLARIMAHGAEEHLGRIAHSLGLKLEPNRRFHLYVYPTHIGFIKAGGLQERKFTVGTAQSNEIISIDASGVFETADRIMAHEITHAVIFRILGRQAVRLPLWLNEGLAEYQSQDYPDKAQARAADAAADNLLIPLSDLSEAFPERQTDLAYSESFLAAKYMVDEFGKSAPRRLLAELARRGSFDEAARNTIGIGGAEFQDRWYEATTSRYRTLALTRIAAAVGSVVMACLAIVAFLVRRKQKIEAARRWEQEEFEDYLRRQLNDDWHR